MKKKKKEAAKYAKLLAKRAKEAKEKGKRKTGTLRIGMKSILI